MGKYSLPVTFQTVVKVNKQDVGVLICYAPIIYVLLAILLDRSGNGFKSLHNRVNIKMGIIYKNVNNTLFPLEI
jgi:hypothetical protein